MRYLVVMEVSQKQRYIFRTNRLAEQIGASILIRELTEKLPRCFSSQEEFVFAGGGKSVYEFSSEADAKLFVKNVSIATLRDYPGVELFMAIQDYNEKTESVIEAINQLYGKLEEKKSSRELSFRFYGSGMEELCSSTQLPAAGLDRRSMDLASDSNDIEVYASIECLTKLDAYRKQKESFRELLPGPGYRFAHKFSELGGTSGEKDYIAVVVLDGNKMGKKIEKFRDDFKKQHGEVNEVFNLEYKKRLRLLSEEIDRNFQESVKAMISYLSSNLDEIKKKVISVEETQIGNEIVLPIRPLILAGDDICFVTDVRIGIALTERLLTEIEKPDRKVQGLPLHACAGIAMVKTSYPFYRAHELAESLCSNAKGVLPADDSSDASVLDFHLVQGEIEGSIKEIRREKYNHGKLTSKPFYLRDNGKNNCLSWFKNRLSQYASGIFYGKKVGKSTIKEYRDALSEGEGAAKKYLIYKKLENILGNGYENGICKDFDVIEMIDICKWMG